MAATRSLTQTQALNPSDLDWWWQVGLDGVVGTVLGLLIAVLTVIVTVRHDRRLAEINDVRQGLARLESKLIRRSIGQVTSEGRQAPGWTVEDLVDIWAEVDVLTALSDYAAPRLAHQLYDIGDGLMGVVESRGRSGLLDSAAQRDTERTIGYLQAAITDFRENPGKVRKPPWK